MTRRTACLLLIALGPALTAAAVSSSRWQQVPARDHARTNPLQGQPGAVASGALVYREHCQQCHKADASGDGHRRPPLRGQRLSSVSDGDIEWFLRQGDLAHGMPSWASLPEAQRWQLVAYVRSLQ